MSPFKHPFCKVTSCRPGASLFPPFEQSSYRVTSCRPGVPLILILIALIISCRPEAPPVSLDPPPTPVLTSQSIWGVANKAYLKVLSRPDPSADVNGFLRRGDLTEVIAKIAADHAEGYWLEIRRPDGTGWLRDTDLDVYDTRHQARTAGAALKE